MKALLLLGCPEVPSQTPMAIYAISQLSDMGYEVTVSSNPAAAKLLKVSDPKNCYPHKNVNIDRFLEDAGEKDFDLVLGFVHKDSAATYYITYCSVMNYKKAIALVFQRDASLVEDYTQMVSENTDAEVVSCIAYHNPNPIKVNLNKALKNLKQDN